MKQYETIDSSGFNNLYFLISGENDLVCSELMTAISNLTVQKTIVISTEPGNYQRDYAALSTMPKQTSSYALALDHYNQINANDIGRFFLLRQYRFINNKPVIFISGQQNVIRNLLNEWCIAQSMSTPKYFDMSVISPGELARHLLSTIINTATTENSTPLLVKADKKMMPAISQSLDDTDILLRQRSELPLLQHIASLREKLASAEKEKEYCKKEVTVLKEFNSLLNNHSETEKILRFYHEQYEVLPLWYKRVGHIIKMLTGHRKLTWTKKAGS